MDSSEHRDNKNFNVTNKIMIKWIDGTIVGHHLGFLAIIMRLM